MKLSLTCTSCGKVLAADDEEELATLGQAHALEHGHTRLLSREHVLARVRRHNRGLREAP